MTKPFVAQTVRWASTKLALLLAVLGVSPNVVFAHDFGAGKGAYEDFIAGSQAVFVDLPIVLGLIVTGILVSLWKLDGLPKVWLFFIAGIVVGVAVGVSGLLPPTLTTYLAVCGVGLIGALSPKLSLMIMRSIVVIMGLILANAVLSGHSLAQVQPFAFVGFVFALNLGLAVSAGLAALSIEKLPYGWVNIAWRALMSWLVAIAIMAMVLVLKSPPTKPLTLLSTTGSIV